MVSSFLRTIWNCQHILSFILHFVSVIQISAFVHHRVLSFPWTRTIFVKIPLFATESNVVANQQSSSSLLNAFCEYYEVKIPTSQSGPPRQAICVEDLTPTIQQHLQQSGLKNGVVTIISRHTTTAITINERESRLAKDMEQFFRKLVPPDERSAPDVATPSVRYLHNDIDQRPDGDEESRRCRENGWDIEQPHILQQWRDQEPINAHSHLLVMLLGSSESIPVQDGRMVIGQWQSVLLVDCDAPRDRTVGIQFMGFK